MSGYIKTGSTILYAQLAYKYLTSVVVTLS